MQSLLNIIGFGNIPPKKVAGIHASEIKLEMEPLGRGAYGTVYKGNWNGKPVAIKHFQNRDEFYIEVYQLSRLNHNQIVTMYGVCTAKSYIVLELAENTLYDALHGYVNGERVKYTIGHAISWFNQCADGLAFIHSKGLVHRDVKSLNLLLFNSGRTIKIADFGACTDIKMVMTNNKGTMGWQAPEVIIGTKYNEKADTYSFGILLWEVLSQEYPYPWRKLDVDTLKLLPLIEYCPHRDQIIKLMIDCLDPDPAKRPTMSQVSKEMTNLSTFYPDGASSRYPLYDVSQDMTNLFTIYPDGASSRYPIYDVTQDMTKLSTFDPGGDIPLYKVAVAAIIFCIIIILIFCVIYCLFGQHYSYFDYITTRNTFSVLEPMDWIN